jgi:hypothetical protein
MAGFNDKIRETSLTHLRRFIYIYIRLQFLFRLRPSGLMAGIFRRSADNGRRKDGDYVRETWMHYETARSYSFSFSRRLEVSRLDNSAF